MINFPVFDQLDVLDYGLYPGGNETQPGLHVRFYPGLTLVLGANGLGKTTMIRILFRLLTGAFDIPRIEDRPDLGTARLDAVRLSAKDRKTFAARVMDGARNATAVLSFGLGPHSVTVGRRLSDLSLARFEIDGQEISFRTEKDYQERITDLVNISSFGEWILLLRFLTFYFEDRRALVWDPSAQKQILRILLLPTAKAKKWRDAERSILELDSEMRNLRVIVNRAQRDLIKGETKASDVDNIRGELDSLESQHDSESLEYARLEDELIDLDSARRNARLRVLKSEQEREEKFRNVERLKYAIIGSQFPSSSETARYILAQLLTDQDCIVCGNHVPQVAKTYSARIEHAQCIICGSEVATKETPLFIREQEKEVRQAIEDLGRIEADLAESRHALETANTEYQSRVSQLDKLRVSLDDRARRIDYLVGQLPPEEAEMHQQRSQLALLRNQLEELKGKLDGTQEEFRELVEEFNLEIAKFKNGIKTSFDQYAEGFLLEQCKLTWAPQKARVGQTGKGILFPAFELDMAGAGFPSLVRRSGPEQVSESQREFIDLAFRAALMSVSTNHACSLVMDAPESSLDSVFAPRAAQVLSHFANATPGNRLIITSNLVEGKLIPSLIESIPPVEVLSRVVDLVKNAAPTAAVRERRSEYESILHGLLVGYGMDDTYNGR